jgi:dienelactone hydrolase
LEIDATQEIIGAKHLNIPIKGNMIDSLDDQENLLYFAKNSIYSKKKNGIYKLDVSNEKSIKKSTKNPHQIIKKLKDAVYGLTANDGVIRFIITSEYVKKNDLIRLHYWFLSKGSDWKEIYTVDLEQDVVVPRMISNDQTFFYATTNNFGDKVAIHKYSTNDFSHLGVFYENNNLEITGIKQDSLTKEIIGVNHVEQGFTKTKYFENDNDNLMPLREKYKDHNFYSAQHNKSINKTLVFSTNEYSKGSWSIYDNKTTKVDKLFETNPSYTKLEKGIFLNIKTKSIDGIDLEGYLVVPKNSKGKKLPLVVIPHGGPIGVRDYAYNSDVQHFYASQGLASLKVNYRGSGGYGKNFKDLGRKQWGKKIESDINHMVEYAIDNYNISNDNICAMGSSYGGYSAVMLTILYPDRYKCAVSFAGVMDIPLMFTSSDFSKNKKSIEEFKKIVGDPENESQSLIQDSPLYLVDKITNPVLLFHGAYDKRVSAEHSFRMKELLDMTNKESDLIILENEAHSLNFIESEIVYISRSLVFIKKQLGLEN